MADAPPTAERRPLRILLGCDTFAPDMNGAAKFEERLAAGLIDRGHEVHIVAPAFNRRHGRFIETHEGHRMIVHRLKSWRWYPHPWLRFALPWEIEENGRRLLDEIQPDVVHFQSHIIVGRGLSKAAIDRGIRLIGTNHFMPENALQFTLIPKPFLARAVKAAWRAADRSFSRAEAVTAPTRRAADFLEQHTSIAHVYAISCGLTVSDYTARIGPRDDNRIVFVGRVEEEKQLDKLLRAFARLDPALGATLEIIGDGDARRALEALSSELGLRDRVRFAGRVSDEYVKSALTAASVFAMPSIAELQSIATMEAMASGLPVVAADAMALPHLVHDGANGFLFPPGDVETFAARLTEVLTATPERFEAMQRESLRIVASHDIGNTLDTFEALYRGEKITEHVGDPAAGSASH